MWLVKTYFYMQNFVKYGIFMCGFIEEIVPVLSILCVRRKFKFAYRGKLLITAFNLAMRYERL